MSRYPSTEEFIRAAFGPDFNGHACLWNRRTGQTKFYRTDQLSALASEIERQKKTSDLYLALGTQEKPLLGNKRGGADTVVSLNGFVADIDFGDAKESTKKYVPNKDLACEILRRFGFPPTAIISTGGGLHTHWFLDKPLLLRSRKERAYAKKIWKKFQRSLQKLFERMTTKSIVSVTLHGTTASPTPSIRNTIHPRLSRSSNSTTGIR